MVMVSLRSWTRSNEHGHVVGPLDCSPPEAALRSVPACGRLRHLGGLPSARWQDHLGTRFHRRFGEPGYGTDARIRRSARSTPCLVISQASRSASEGGESSHDFGLGRSSTRAFWSSLQHRRRPLRRGASPREQGTEGSRSYMKYAIGRLPILDRRHGLHAYHLLARRTSHGTDDATVSSSQLIVDAFLDLGIEKIAGQHTTYINVSEEFLVRPELAALAPGRSVLVVPASIRSTPPVVDEGRPRDKGGTVRPSAPDGRADGGRHDAPLRQGGAGRSSCGSAVSGGDEMGRRGHGRGLGGHRLVVEEQFQVGSRSMPGPLASDSPQYSGSRR